jgi:hypothetical protein
LSSEESARFEKVDRERRSLESNLVTLARVPMVYAGTFDAKPEPTFRLHRGDALQKREQVQSGALSAVPVIFHSPPHSNRPLTDDQQRRLALAEWIVNPTNPLPARVMVNRIWQYHFGEGLVSTPGDLGANGGLPTHPELLDWLASEFIEHGWSIKHIHLLIVGSKTYQQSSKAKSEALEIDAGSRLLWRFPPRRLEAEAIRDTILSICGKLDLKASGPGFDFFEPNDNYVRVYAPRREWPPDTFRRMIYGTVIRQRPDGVFGAFDCPDGGQIAPKRGASTTPLQALNLLNSEFILQQAGLLAERLRKEAGEDPGAQCRRAFELAFQRPADSQECEAGAKLIRDEGLRVFCRALLNANEIVYLF